MQIVKQYLRKELEGFYPKSEIESFERLIFEKIFDLDYTGLILNRNKIINSEDRRELKVIIERLKRFEPIQYILGETAFCNLGVKVNPSVLIPRPETEELVHWIIKTNKNPSPEILDIGTGSGCISLALKKNIGKAGIYGIDISESALVVARDNAKYNKLNVDFSQVNILQWEEYSWKNFDIVVSNPPYVRESEKKQMEFNVLNFEPEYALYVGDEDPLIFYKRIAGFASENLKKGGFLYFEINENFAVEIKDLLLGLSFSNIEIKKDIYGKDRFIRCNIS